MTPVRSGVQVSTSLDDLGNSRAEDSEQTTAKNVPESSPNNTDENTANHEVINLNARDGDGAQDDLISRSQSGTDYMMASSSESNEEFDCPRKGAMKVIDAREAGKEDETLSTAAGNNFASEALLAKNPNLTSSGGYTESHSLADHRTEIFKSETTVSISGSVNVGHCRQPDDDQTTNFLLMIKFH